MCSSSPVKDKETEKNSKATSTSCCPGTFSRTRRVARALVKRLHNNPYKVEKCEPVIGLSIGGQNNENLPPQEMTTGNNGVFKKKYTVNKKRSDQESFDRLRKHVPAIQADPDASQLDVLLEAIQYIQTLRKDLGKDDKQPLPPGFEPGTFGLKQEQDQHQNHALRDV